MRDTSPNPAPSAVFTATPVHVPATFDLALMDTRTLTSHAAATNTAFEQARNAYEDACQALGDMLTENICRHLIDTYGPDALILQARAAADFCNTTCQHDTDCPGHNIRLMAAIVISADGTILGHPDVLSPVNYWLERLTALMGTEDAVLHLTDREWAFGSCG